MFACIVVIPAAATSAPVSCEALIQFAFGFSPRIELVAADTVLLDLEGLAPLFGPPEKLAQAIASRAAESGMQVNIAIAQNTEAAQSAASGFAGTTVVPPGEEARVLSGLPLALLSASLEMEQTWNLWGLRSFGDLAALPENGVAERLGSEGLRLHRIARGAEHRPLIPLIPSPDFEASQELDYPLELLEPLSFILASLLNQVCASLEARGKAASQIHLRLKLDAAEHSPADYERHLSLPVPLRDSTALLKLVRLDLEAHPPPAPILAVWLRAEAGQPRVTQNGLFLPPAPEPGKLEITLARIAKLVGEENAGSPELLNTHRPDAFALRPFRLTAPQHKACSAQPPGHPLACRVFRPPLWAEVECSRGRPARIRARGVQGKVISCAGPWRTSGDWWTADPWQREEWDIELTSLSREANPSRNSSGAPGAPLSARWGARQGAVNFPELANGCRLQPTARPLNSLYRIYRELATGSWYVEAAFD